MDTPGARGANRAPRWDGRPGDGLDPLMVREYRRLLRSPLLTIAFLGLHAVLLIVSVIETGAVALAPGRGGGLSGWPGGGLLDGVGALAFGLLLPLAHFRSLRAELGEGRNAELLVMAGLGPWQIVGGRVLAATALCAVLLVSVMPYALLRYFLGGLELPQLAGTMLKWLLWNFSTNAIVIGGSVYAPVAGRAAMITGCLLVRQLMEAPYQLGAPGLLGPSPGFPWTTAGSVLVTLLFAYAGCLIGVRGLRPVWKSGSPSDSGLILAMLLFFVPFLHGVAVLIGGIAAGLAMLLLLLLAFHLTYPSRIRKKELKRGGRETLLPTS